MTPPDLLKQFATLARSLTGRQAMQEVKAGDKAIYLSTGAPTCSTWRRIRSPAA